jgi:hypothetical protein
MHEAEVIDDEPPELPEGIEDAPMSLTEAGKRLEEAGYEPPADPETGELPSAAPEPPVMDTAHALVAASEAEAAAFMDFG